MLLILPQIGITPPPVIDKGTATFNDGAMYLVAMSKDASGHYHQRLHALDLRTGAELFGGPVEITATYPEPATAVRAGRSSSTPDSMPNAPRCWSTAVPSILPSRRIATTRPYTGWIMAYNCTHTGSKPRSSISRPTVVEGAFWMAGSGLAADANGNIFVLAGNGTFDTTLTTAGLSHQR